MAISRKLQRRFENIAIMALDAGLRHDNQALCNEAWWIICEVLADTATIERAQDMIADHQFGAGGWTWQGLIAVSSDGLQALNFEADGWPCAEACGE